MVGYVEVEVERFRRVVIVFLVSDISSLHHLLKYHVAAFAAALGIAYWIEI